MATRTAAGRRSLWRLALGAAAAIVVASLAPGCGGTRIDASQIAPFRQGVATADQHSQTAFTEANAFFRETQIDRATTLDTLSPESFITVLEPTETAKWTRAFNSVDKYAAKLEKLLAPEQREGVEDELQRLGSQFQQFSETEFPNGVAAAFTTLGGLLVQVKIQRDALEIVQRVDPAVQKIFATMALAIGEDSSSGLRAAVEASWRQRLAALSRDFLVARNDGEDTRRIVEQYADTMDQMAAHDAALSSLRFSLLTLARAHSDLATGDAVTATSLIRIVQNEYKRYRDELQRLKEAQGE